MGSFSAETIPRKLEFTIHARICLFSLAVTDLFERCLFFTLVTHNETHVNCRFRMLASISMRGAFPRLIVSTLSHDDSIDVVRKSEFVPK